MNHLDHKLHLDTIGCDAANTIPGLFLARLQHTPRAIAYQQYNPSLQQWQSYTWEAMSRSVARWQQALSQEGLEPGERVAVMLANSVELVSFDLAAQMLGLVVISLYTTDTPNNIAYILGDSDSRVLLINKLDDWHKLEGQLQSHQELKRVICLQTESNVASEDARVVGINDWLPQQARLADSHVSDPNALATLVYTSGTTGRPKGVMLSHRNILWNAEAVIKHIPAYREDVFLSFLPMAHSFERTVEYYMPMMAGSTVAFCRSIPHLSEDLATIHPTILLSPPRIYEKIYAALLEKAEKSRLEGLLINWTVALGWKRFQAQQQRGRRPGWPAAMAYTILHGLVSRKVLARLGGRLRLAVTGAAPLAEEIAHFFIGLGLPLVEGYGLTEAAPTVCANQLDDNMPGSVGKVLPGVEVRLADKGELLVRSPSVMMGYWNNEKKTEKTIDKEGWLHTGDVAKIEDDRIYIRGRLKEIIVTSTGEKVAPGDMEMSITMHPLFEQALIVGEGKPFLVALLVLNPLHWEQLANKMDVAGDDPQSLALTPVRKAIIDMLAVILNRYPIYAQVHKVYLSLEPWSVENGLLTPTLKIKRAAIEKRYEDEIKELYHGHKLVE